MGLCVIKTKQKFSVKTKGGRGEKFHALISLQVH